MKTFFAPAPFSRFDLGRHVRVAPRLGQMVDPYLSDAERIQLVAQIDAALARVKPIEDILAWSGDNDPGLKIYLGQDATRFYALSNSIAPLYPSVEQVYERLTDTDAENWFRPNDEEYAAIRQWTTGINEMYRILQNRRTGPLQLAPGTKPPPTLTPTAPQLISRGPSTNDILIAGGIALGLGVLISAIV